MEPERPEDEAALFQRVKCGDRDALCKLAEPWILPLAGFQRYRVNSALRAVLSFREVMQETLLAICRDYPQFRGNSIHELRCWVKEVFVHHLANSHRRYLGTQMRDPRRQFSIEPDDEASHQMNDFLRAVQPSPSQVAMGREQFQRLLVALDSLKPAEQLAIQLKYFDFLSVEEIAEFMELNRTDDPTKPSTDAVTSLIYRGLRRLRRLLAPDFPELGNQQ